MHLRKKNFFQTSGERLRAIRAFCAPSRKKFCDDSGLSESTLKAWENDISPLTGTGANMLADIFQKQGIACTQAWLLRGEDPSPIRKLSTIPSQKLREADSINQEIALLQACYQRPKNHFVAFMIQDQGMEPFFSKGSWVAGVQIKPAKLKFFLENPLIFQDHSNQLIIRQFVGFKSPGDILVQHPKGTEKKGSQSTIKAKTIYQIVWNRCLKI